MLYLFIIHRTLIWDVVSLITPGGIYFCEITVIGNQTWLDPIQRFKSSQVHFVVQLPSAGLFTKLISGTFSLHISCGYGFGESS